MRGDWDAQCITFGNRPRGKAALCVTHFTLRIACFYLRLT